MSSFHDQVFSEIESARKLAAEFANRHGRGSSGPPRVPKEEDRQVQEEAAAAEIEALAAEEDRLAQEARQRAELRAIARAEANARTGEIREAAPVASPVTTPKPAKSRWNAMTILDGLARLRAKERSAAEDLIRKARAIRDKSTSAATAAAEAHDESGQEAPPSAPLRGMWRPSHGAAQQWFFTSAGTRCGPVTFTELRTMATSRVLDPRHDRVWKQGMGDWKQAGLLDGLFERRPVPAEATDRRGVKMPRAIAALPAQLNAALASKNLNWPGSGRLTLWLGLLLFPVIWSQILRWSGPSLAATFGTASMEKVFPWAALMPVPVLAFLVLMRFVNLGMSRWWALGLAVPIVNLWIAFRCLFCPPGHAYHRKLDRTGWVTALSVVVIAPVVFYINQKHPGLLSAAQLQAALHRLIEGVVKILTMR